MPVVVTSSEVEYVMTSAMAPPAPACALRPVLQELGDVVGAPSAEAGALVARQVGRDPVVEVAAVQFLAALVGAEEILRRVAGAAVARALDQVRAAVPFGRLARVGLPVAGVKEQQVPSLRSRKRTLSGNGSSFGGGV